MMRLTGLWKECVVAYFLCIFTTLACKIAETLSEESVCDSKFKPGTSGIRKNANHSAARVLLQIRWMLLCRHCCAVLIMPASNQRCLSHRQTISPLHSRRAVARTRNVCRSVNSACFFCGLLRPVFYELLSRDCSLSRPKHLILVILP